MTDQRPNNRHRIMLTICDGFGLNPRVKGNAVKLAIESGQAPFLAGLFQDHPYARLRSSGRAVGLPPGTMGNSEVNHLNMGAGRVVYQSIERINVAIKDKTFFSNPALLAAVETVKRNNSTLHLMGILQGPPGTVHGDIEHLFALLVLAKKHSLTNIRIHLFTDGRDTNPQAALNLYLPMLEAKIEEMGLTGTVKIASVMGREICMDRDSNWDKILTALKMLATGQGERKFATPREALEFAYKQSVQSGSTTLEESDEFVRPSVIGDFSGIKPQDTVIFWNFRQDRGIELTMAFRESAEGTFNYKMGGKTRAQMEAELAAFQGPQDQREILERQLKAGISAETFETIQKLRQSVANIVFVCMTEYYAGLNALTAFPENAISPTVGSVYADQGLRQLRIAGPEKFAHVTGWFSGRRGEEFPGETRVIVRDATLGERTNQGKNYNLAPEMTAPLEAQQVIEALDSKQYDLIVHNYQNLDMVGHTGDLDATIKAVSVVSDCLAKTWPHVQANGYIWIITADHGNADEELIKDKEGPLVKSTQHSTYPVPLWVLNTPAGLKVASRGIVPQVGTTILYLAGLPVPPEMTAGSLIIH